MKLPCRSLGMLRAYTRSKPPQTKHGSFCRLKNCKFPLRIPPPGAMLLDFGICTMPSATFGPTASATRPWFRSENNDDLRGGGLVRALRCWVHRSCLRPYVLEGCPENEAPFVAGRLSKGHTHLIHSAVAKFDHKCA